MEPLRAVPDGLGTLNTIIDGTPPVFGFIQWPISYNWWIRSAVRMVLSYSYPNIDGTAPRFGWFGYVEYYY